MPIIDTHCHAAPMWYESVESLIYHMDQNEVAQALLVQIKGYYDNAYQFACAQRYPGRLRSVVAVDLTRPDAATALERLVDQGACGVRISTDGRSPADDPLVIWRKAAQWGLPVSCGGARAQFADPAFANLIEALPTLPIIIEHLGGITWADGAATEPERERIFALARYPNVYLKIHGLGEFLPRNMPVTTPFPFDPIGLSLLERAYTAFGPERLLWGSDYPPVAGREGYARALAFTREALADKGKVAIDQIFGGTAATLYQPR